MEWIYYLSCALSILVVAALTLLVVAVMVGATTKIMVESMRNIEEIRYGLTYWLSKQKGARYE